MRRSKKFGCAIGLAKDGTGILKWNKKTPGWDGHFEMEQKDAWRVFFGVPRLQNPKNQMGSAAITTSRSVGDCFRGTEVL
jgi:hypothetical protein